MTGQPEKSPVSLYVHIPFCIRKCRYCDFLSGPQDDLTREAYVKALIHEIRLCGEMAGTGRSPGTGGREADTVYLGGGTPSILSAEQIFRIMEALHRAFSVRKDAEISLEMNPGTADREKLSDLKKIGINRLSIGVQSMHDEELQLLGRIHTARQAREAYTYARDAGFSNVSLDLMSALPGQTSASWADTLRQAVEWNPEHISAYSLIIEPETPFFTMYEEGELPPLPDEDSDREMYHYTRTFLAENGYSRYEISNYARTGRESCHNSGYWTGHPYLGFGIGAASYLDGTRFSNIRSIGDYLVKMKGGALSGNAEDQLTAIREDVHELSVEEQMEEFMFLGLRMTAGVQTESFSRKFGCALEDVYGNVIRRHLARGVLKRTEGGFCLTERGIDVSNYVLADYLLS